VNVRRYRLYINLKSLERSSPLLRLFYLARTVLFRNCKYAVQHVRTGLWLVEAKPGRHLIRNKALQFYFSCPNMFLKGSAREASTVSDVRRHGRLPLHRIAHVAHVPAAQLAGTAVETCWEHLRSSEETGIVV
jgi:hypothetical protein